MKNYDPILSLEEAQELNKDLYNTKIDQATIECRFKPQFDLLDRKGEVTLCLKEIFPNDFNDPDVEKNIEYEYDEEGIKISSTIIKTYSYFGLNRSFIHRQGITPTTLHHFSKIGIEHMKMYKKLFPNIDNLERFGYRIKQNNRIPEEKIKSCKNNFSKEFLNTNKFSSKLKNNNVIVKFNDFAVSFNLKETILNNDKISDYFIRLQITLVGGNTDDKCFLNTDMDFYVKDNKELFLIDNAIILCKRISERANEIHKIIFEVITNV